MILQPKSNLLFEKLIISLFVNLLRTLHFRTIHQLKFLFKGRHSVCNINGILTWVHLSVCLPKYIQIFKYLISWFPNHWNDCFNRFLRCWKTLNINILVIEFPASFNVFTPRLCVRMLRLVTRLLATTKHQNPVTLIGDTCNLRQEPSRAGPGQTRKLAVSAHPCVRRGVCGPDLVDVGTTINYSLTFEASQSKLKANFKFRIHKATGQKFWLLCLF